MHSVALAAARSSPPLTSSFCRITCTSRSAETVPTVYESLGCATLAALAQAATDWTDAHKLSLFILASVIIDSYGGTDLVLNSRRAIIVDIGPPIHQSDSTPATALTLRSASLVDRDHYALAEPLWTTPSAVRHRNELLQILRAASPHPDLMGLVPVMVRIECTKLYLMINLPLYRRRGGVGPVDQRTKAELKKVMETCIDGINTGTVLRIPTDADQKMPDLGKLVQKGKSWMWTPYVSRARMPVANMWGSFCAEGFAAYHRLWPYSSLIYRTKPSSWRCSEAAGGESGTEACYDFNV